jgi:hypothetical protein
MTDDETQHQLRVIQRLVTRYGSLQAARRVETYTYTIVGVGHLTWDITHAQAMIAAGRAVGWDEVPRDELQRIATTWDLDPAKLAGADPRVPGIAAPILDAGREVYILIDGAHRACQAYRTGVPFRAQVLSHADSRACVLEAPPSTIP